MSIKIQLPDPYDVSAEEFFSQARISLKAAERTYQESIKDLTDEEKDNIFIAFRHSDELEKKLITSEWEAEQELYIEVVSI